jgi:hypothetical protein
MEPPEGAYGASEALVEAAPAVEVTQPVQGHLERQVPERWEPPVQPDRPTLDAWMQAQDR